MCFDGPEMRNKHVCWCGFHFYFSSLSMEKAHSMEVKYSKPSWSLQSKFYSFGFRRNVNSDSIRFSKLTCRSICIYISERVSNSCTLTHLRSSPEEPQLTRLWVPPVVSNNLSSFWLMFHLILTDRIWLNLMWRWFFFSFLNPSQGFWDRWEHPYTRVESTYTSEEKSPLQARRKHSHMLGEDLAGMRQGSQTTG